MNIPKDKLYQMLYGMILVRRTTEMIREKFSEEKMRHPLHLAMGQEASAVGVCAALEKEDIIFSGHRSQAQYLSKGGDLNKMIAEFYGKSTGCTSGVGGAMRLYNKDAGIIGTSAIVGGILPIALGASLALKKEGKKSMASVFFGDAATEEGVFSESINFAALKKAPLLFICENNGLSTITPLSKRQVNPLMSDKVKPYNIFTIRVDGSNVLDVYKAVKDMVGKIKEGEGPMFIEIILYRWLEHVGPNFDYDLGHRDKEEVMYMMENKCPIKLFKKYLFENNLITKEYVENIENDIKGKILNAFEFAEKSPEPILSEILKNY